MTFIRLITLLSLMVWLPAGCAHWQANSRLERVEPGGGYRFDFQARESNRDDMIVILAFSGGGTRAAAFSFGVLEELSRTQIAFNGRHRRFLDEVDIISAVSGGSFTASYYALHGDRIFSEFEDKFLKRNVEGDLYRKVMNPVNCCRLASPSFSRSDLAAEYYDERLFGGATFGDLAEKRGPIVIINGTDLSTGARFTFTQEQFNLICSDLSRFPISRAVAASSAYPPSLSPISLVNYAGACGYVEPPWMAAIDRADSEASGRARFRLKELRSYRDSRQRPYIHLFDGGISDNLGLRGILEGLDAMEADLDAVRAPGLKKIRRIVVILVNARHAPEKGWDRLKSPPADAEIMDQAMGIPIDRYSYETIDALREKVEKWRRMQSFHLIEIGFESIQDEAERRYFLDLPTSFTLSGDAVDRLRSAGAALLRRSPEYQRLVNELKTRESGP